jgi:hypothetical protein
MLVEGNRCMLANASTWNSQATLRSPPLFGTTYSVCILGQHHRSREVSRVVVGGLQGCDTVVHVVDKKDRMTRLGLRVLWFS